MSTMQRTTLLQQRGQDLYDADGDKIGTIEEIYLDAQSGEPEWALVNTGMFGTKSSFVPLQGASQDGDTLRVPYDKAQVKDAPKVDPDGELSQQQESELYAHYGLDYGESRSDSGLPEGGAGATAPRPHGRGRHRRPRHLRPDDRRRDDALRGGAARRHDPAGVRPRAAAQVRRRGRGHADRPGQARGGPHRARADHGRQRRRGHGRPGHLRGGARGRAPRGGGRHREARRAEGAHPHGQGDRHATSSRSPRPSARSRSTSTARAAAPARPPATPCLPLSRRAGRRGAARARPCRTGCCAGPRGTCG